MAGIIAFLNTLGPLWQLLGGISAAVTVAYGIVRIRRWLIRDVSKILGQIAHTLGVKDDEDDGDTVATKIGAAADQSKASSEAADRIELLLEQRAAMDRMAENNDNVWAAYLLLMEILKDQKLPERVRYIEQYLARQETERRTALAGDITEGTTP